MQTLGRIARLVFQARNSLVEAVILGLDDPAVAPHGPTILRAVKQLSRIHEAVRTTSSDQQIKAASVAGRAKRRLKAAENDAPNGVTIEDIERGLLNPVEPRRNESVG
jgi:hypothetical protein